MGYRTFHIKNSGGDTFRLISGEVILLHTPPLSGQFLSLAANVRIDAIPDEVARKEGDGFLLGTISRGGSVGFAAGVVYRDERWRVSYAINHGAPGVWLADGDVSGLQVATPAVGQVWELGRISMASCLQPDRGDTIASAYCKDGGSAQHQHNKATSSADPQSMDHIPVLIARNCSISLIELCVMDSGAPDTPEV